MLLLSYSLFRYIMKQWPQKALAHKVSVHNYSKFKFHNRDVKDVWIGIFQSLYIFETTLLIKTVKTLKKNNVHNKD